MNLRSLRARDALAVALLSFGLVACGGAGANHPETPPPDPLTTVEPSELYRRGVILAQRGDYVRAEQYLQAARARGEPDARVVPILMEVCVRSSRLSAAITYAEPFLEAHPTEWALRILVASIHLGLGHLDEAHSHLERALADAPQPPAEAIYLLAVTLGEQGDDPGSRANYQRYLELDPNGTHAEEARGVLREPPLHVAQPVAPPVTPATVPQRLAPPGGETPPHSTGPDSTGPASTGGSG